ncbi:hypothetical protein [Streptomyces sp. NPDC001380]|uniref:hypothetical protein n=1 Tax=Streptomyces sp. NPDC001380 TaxID=3364566 RepID=UPI0036874DC7
MENRSSVPPSPKAPAAPSPNVPAPASGRARGGGPGPAVLPARSPAGARLRGTAWVRWLAVGALLTGCCSALPRGRAGDALYAATGVASALAVVLGARLHRPAAAGRWYLLAAAQLLRTCGDVVYGLREDVLHRPPFPSAADVLHLAAYPVLATALHALTRRRGPGSDRAGLLDGALIATGLGLLCWVFLMRPAAGGSLNGPFAQLLSLAYPAADLVVAAMVLRVLVPAGLRNGSYWLLAASLVLLTLTDSAFAALSAAGRGDARILDAGWLLSYLLWGAAALHPSMRTLSEVAGRAASKLTRRRLAVLAAATLLAPGVLFAQGACGAERIDWLAVSVASAVLFLLVVVRVADLAAQVQVQADRLAELAGSDGLTGIPNRRT